MNLPFDKVAAAWLPQVQLRYLAGVRCRSDVVAILTGEKAWVTWPAEIDEVWQALLPCPECEFYEERDHSWYRLGRRLPALEFPPKGEPKSLDAILFPAPAQSVLPPVLSSVAVRLQLVADDRVRPTSALRCSIAYLQEWADSATGKELADCQAAYCGELVVLRGGRLPGIPTAERFWGKRVWMPLGFCPEPNLPESAVRAAAEVSPDELLLLTQNGAEAIPEGLFAPVTRAGVQLLRRR